MAAETFKSLFESEDFAYQVPSYQRAYAWRKDEQLKQFLTDLEEQPAGKDYYLGHFLLERHHATKPHFNVIDGQQRMTTAVIFFSALAQELQAREDRGEALLNSEGDPVEPRRIRERYLTFRNRARLSTVPDDHHYFEQAILHNKHDAKPNKQRQAQKRLQEASSLFQKRFQSEETATLLHWHQLVEGARITKYEVTDKVQATQIFAFQNDRGLSLTGLEKLKAYLMHRSYLDDATEEVEKTISHVEGRFGEMYKLSEEISVNENAVFSYHNAAFGRGDDAFEGVKQALKDVPAEQRPSWIRNYTEMLRDSFHTVQAVDLLARGYSNVTGVLHLDASSSWPLLLTIQRYHYRDEDEKLRERLYRLMEIILFKKAYSVSNYRTNDFHSLARNYRGDSQKLIADLKWRAAHGFQPYWSFTSDFKRRLVSDNHYERTTRYLLWNYENHLRQEVKRQGMAGADLLNSWGRTDWRQTLDHITPQNGSYSPEFVEKYLHNLGNLALMPQGPNSRKSDTSAEEAEAYQITTSLADQEIAKLMGASNQWGEEEIRERAKRIVAFAESHWVDVD
ncbi:DUF262 domain-containing protein [Hymenobacter daeguensis]